RLPWGGMRLIVVGDFAQLPPVSRSGEKLWAFTHQVWESSGFQPYYLKFNHRVMDPQYLRILSFVRRGEVNEEVRGYLDACVAEEDFADPGTRLFPRRDPARLFNERKLAEIERPETVLPTLYFGPE